MELYAQILSKILENKEVNVIFPEIKINANEIIENECYKALCEIRAIIDDDKISDEECFLRIEKIIQLFEKWDCLEGYRHDF